MGDSQSYSVREEIFDVELGMYAMRFLIGLIWEKKLI